MEYVKAITYVNGRISMIVQTAKEFAIKLPQHV